MTQERVIKSTSFSSKDEYEAELLEFATQQSRYFGRYVKRLIAEHRDRLSRGSGGLPAQAPYEVAQVIPSAPKTQSKRKVAEEVKPIESHVKDVSHDFADDVSNFV